MTLYSYSRLTTFEQCPYKFKLQYLDRVKPEIKQTVEAFLGSMVHDALEKLYIDLRFQIKTTLPELLEFYNEEWNKKWSDDILVVRENYNADNYKKMGEKYITDFYNRYSPFDKDRTIGIETKKKATLDDNYDIHIRVDRLALSDDDTYEIHDYKTANTLPTQEDADNDKQLAIYAYGIKKMYPDAKKIKLVWHYLAFDKEMVSFRTDKELSDLKDDILGTIKKVESAKEFPATKSALCGWCLFQAHCPHYKHLFETKKLSENEYLNEEGVSLVDKYVRLNKVIKENGKELEKIKQALIAYTDKKEIDVVNGKSDIATIRKYPKLSFPKKEDPRLKDFFGVVKDAGLWDKLAIVNVYELAKMINSSQLDKETVYKLEKFIERGKTTKVYLRKR